MSASDRKRKEPEKPVTRRAGKVAIFHEKVKKQRAKARVYPFKTPKGLSGEARFMELRPTGYSPIEWMRLYTDDESIWEALAEEAEYALLETGEVMEPQADEDVA